MNEKLILTVPQRTPQKRISEEPFTKNNMPSSSTASFVTKTIVIAGLTGVAMTAMVTGPLCVGLVVTPKLVTFLTTQVIVMSAITAHAVND